MSVWLPLESNPDLLTEYMHKLGVSKKWSIVDIIGLDAEVLEWIPKPIKAFILLFPCSESYEEHRANEHKRLSAEPEKHPESLYYMRQLTHNACGSVAILHSIANNKDIEVTKGGLKAFLQETQHLSPEERGRALENNTTLTNQHHEFAKEGQSIVNPEESVYHHFIAIVQKENILYELDGRKAFPVKHGPTTEETFDRDALSLCKEFIARDPDELRFTVMALVPSMD